MTGCGGWREEPPRTAARPVSEGAGNEPAHRGGVAYAQPPSDLDFSLPLSFIFPGLISFQITSPPSPLQQYARMLARTYTHAHTALAHILPALCPFL